MAYECLADGPAACVAFNAANEVAVASFLEGGLGFLEIANIVSYMLEKAGKEQFSSIENVTFFDKTIREHTKSHIIEIQGKRPVSGRAQ